MLDLTDRRPIARPGVRTRMPTEPGSARGVARLQVLSDLHLDDGPHSLPRTVPGVDAVVIAGDTASGVQRSFAFLRAAFPRPTPLVVVLGNHEFHGRHIGRERRLARSLAKVHDVTLLDDTAAVVAGIRFIGGTLWTDYLLEGATAQPDLMLSAAAAIEDHKRISLMAEPWIRFRPYDALAQHHAGRRFLARETGLPDARTTVVVTHHAPSRRSLGLGSARTLDGCFASCMDAMVAGSGAALWIHGHTHSRSDYRIGDTRVVANPRGRAPSPDFDPGLVIEVERSVSFA